MAVGAGVAGEVDEDDFAFGARFGEGLTVLVLEPDQAGLRGGAAGLLGGERDVGVNNAELAAEHAGEQADGEDQKCGAGEEAAEAEVVILLNAFHAQEAEQVEAGESEEHDPGGEETLAGENAPGQDLID